MNYWEKRLLEAQEKEKQLDIKAEKEVERLFSAILHDIEQAIFSFYGKYANAEGLAIEEAKKKVDSFDVQAFKDKAKLYVANEDFSDKANKELKLYNTTMYINREKLLKAQITFLMTYGTARAEKIIKDNMHENVYEYLKYQSGILGENVEITKDALDAIVNMKYFGTNWSDKLWKNQEIIRNKIERMTSNILLRGRHPNEFIADVRKTYKERSTYEIKRLLLTEATRARTEAQTLYFENILGLNGTVEYHAILDDITSDICRDLDGTKIKVKDIKPGINAPPMHPFCRSWLSETIEDLEKEVSELKGKYKGFGKVVLE